MKKVNNAYVYRHIRLDKNEVFYIGIGIQKNFSRAYEKRGRNSYWKNIVSKTQYRVEIIIKDIFWEDACIKEMYFIKLYGRKDLKKGTLCNKTDGGEGGWGIKKVVSKETREKLRKASLGQKKTPEAIERLRESMKGNKFRKGIPHSEEIRKIISERNLGRKHSEETKLKMSLSNPKNNLGKTGADSILSIKIDCYTNEGIFIKSYDSMIEASKEGFSAVLISRCCKGLINDHKGHIFRRHGVKIDAFPKIIKKDLSKKLEIPIFRYSLNGEYLKEYNTNRDLQKDNLNIYCVHQVCRGKKRFYNDCIFIFKGDTYDFTNKEKDFKKSAVSKAINCYSLDGTFVKYYESSADTQKDGFIRTKVSLCCRGKRSSHKGFLWKYAS